jgi:hypothetical protein
VGNGFERGHAVGSRRNAQAQRDDGRRRQGELGQIAQGGDAFVHAARLTITAVEDDQAAGRGVLRWACGRARAGAVEQRSARGRDLAVVERRAAAVFQDARSWQRQGREARGVAGEPELGDVPDNHDLRSGPQARDRIAEADLLM